jgi:hypothetical protein
LVLVPHPGTRVWFLCQFQKLDPVSIWRFLVLTRQRRYLPNIDLNLLFDEGYTRDFHSHLVSLEAPTDQDQSFLIREIISQLEVNSQTVLGVEKIPWNDPKTP